MPAPSNVIYARAGAEAPRPHVHSAYVAEGPLLIIDLGGESTFAPIRERLIPFVGFQDSRIVILRGSGAILDNEIATEQGKEDVAEAFPKATILNLRFDPIPTFSQISGPVVDLNEEQLAKIVAAAELTALMVWNDAIWSGRNYHFAVPSGHHADTFVRIGDIFGDPINISRVADWVSYRIPPNPILICDTAFLLPLLQELRLRHFFRYQEDPPIKVIPLYGNTPRFRDDIAEIVPGIRDQDIHPFVLVSVSATGGYLRESTSIFESFGKLNPPQFSILCQTGDRESVAALTFVQTRQYGDAATCPLCAEHSPVVDIDQRRFTTSFGVRLLSLPKIKELQDPAPIIVDAAEHGAFRVHVDRPDRHGHLSIYIDTKSLLQSEVFTAAATVGLARCLLGFIPDLVLVPEHDGTAAVVDWLRVRKLENILTFPVVPAIPDEIRDRIRAARNILLCDDCVITSRTMRASLDLVQHIKQQVGDLEYNVRAFVLVARPVQPETWNGLSDRFLIRNQRSLFAGWEFFLPDAGVDSRDRCPWCEERKALADFVAAHGNNASAYFDERLQRLSDPNGLFSEIYLLSELARQTEGWDAAVHTTPGSYLGSTTDIGAFVSVAAMVQSMRNQWNGDVRRLSSSYAIPLDVAFQRYTDPVIAAAFLRTVNAQEIRYGEVVTGLAKTISEIDHNLQHPVFGAELLLARLEGKLQSSVDLRPFARLLEDLPDSEQKALQSVFDATVAKAEVLPPQEAQPG